jgi:hypothetical protein
MLLILLLPLQALSMTIRDSLKTDSLKAATNSKHLFLHFASGIGIANSTYTSEVVTGGYGGFNNVDDYSGSGYHVPVEISLGYCTHSFSAGIGFSVLFFHVPTLTRSSSALDSTNATGAPVKHQINTFGKNYVIPLFLEYCFLQKGAISWSARLSFGAMIHDRNAYDGVYAPSSSPQAFGHSSSFSIVPAYNTGKWSFFLSPGFMLTQIRYHGSSNEELTDLYFNLGIGVNYALR